MKVVITRAEFHQGANLGVLFGRDEKLREVFVTVESGEARAIARSLSDSGRPLEYSFPSWRVSSVREAVRLLEEGGDT